MEPRKLLAPPEASLLFGEVRRTPRRFQRTGAMAHAYPHGEGPLSVGEAGVSNHEARTSPILRDALPDGDAPQDEAERNRPIVIAERTPSTT